MICSLCVALHYPYYLLLTPTCFWVAVIPHALRAGSKRNRHVAQSKQIVLEYKKDVFHGIQYKNKPSPNLAIKIDGESMNEVKKTKLLGVIIDKRLSWKDHISYISGKISRGIRVIVQARKYLLKISLINLYYSFIYPYLIYCSHVWGSTCATYLNSLVILQKRVVRIIAGIKPRSPTDHVFKELKLLKCTDINKYLVGRLLYKVYNNDYPLFQAMLVLNKNVHNHNTGRRIITISRHLKQDLVKQGWDITEQLYAIKY